MKRKATGGEWLEQEDDAPVLLMVPIEVPRSVMQRLHYAQWLMAGPNTTYACEVMLGKLLSADFILLEYIETWIEVVKQRRHHERDGDDKNSKV